MVFWTVSFFCSGPNSRRRSWQTFCASLRRRRPSTATQSTSSTAMCVSGSSREWRRSARTIAWWQHDIRWPPVHRPWNSLNTPHNRAAINTRLAPALPPSLRIQLHTPPVSSCRTHPPNHLVSPNTHPMDANALLPATMYIAMWGSRHTPLRVCTTTSNESSWLLFACLWFEQTKLNLSNRAKLIYESIPMYRAKLIHERTPL